MCQLRFFALLFLISVASSSAHARGNLHFSPGLADFGNVRVGSSKTIEVVVTNEGNTRRIITTESLRSQMFRVVEIRPRPPVAIAPGAHVVMSIEFEPAQAGSAQGYMLIESHIIGGQEVLAAYFLKGSGVAPELESRPEKIDFERVPVGTRVSQWVQLKNDGKETVIISGAQVAGSSFATADLAMPLTLAAGATKGFQLRFAPVGIGKHDGAVTFESRSGVKELTLRMKGTGIKTTGTISASTRILTFGDALVGSMETLAVTLHNTGNSNVVISDASVAGIDVWVSGNLKHATIAPGQTATLDLTFAPKKAEHMSGSVNITSNADDSPTVIILSGKGVSPSRHSVGLSWDASGSSGVIGYNVYRLTLPSGMYKKLSGKPVSGQSFTDGTVETGKTYSYAVTAVNSTGEESHYSQSVTASIP